jgi:hypothetical protein
VHQPATVNAAPMAVNFALTSTRVDNKLG